MTANTCMICHKEDSLVGMVSPQTGYPIGDYCPRCAAVIDRILKTNFRINLRLYLVANGWRCLWWNGVEMWSRGAAKKGENPFSLEQAVNTQVKEDLMRKGL